MHKLFVTKTNFILIDLYKTAKYSILYTCLVFYSAETICFINNNWTCVKTRTCEELKKYSFLIA